jgi:hypothetical protein
VPPRAFWFYLPVMLLSVALTVAMMRGCWRNRATLEKLCAANLIVNLSTTAVYIFAFTS